MDWNQLKLVRLIGRQKTKRKTETQEKRKSDQSQRLKEKERWQKEKNGQSRSPDKSQTEVPKKSKYERKFEQSFTKLIMEQEIEFDEETDEGIEGTSKDNLLLKRK